MVKKTQICGQIWGVIWNDFRFSSSAYARGTNIRVMFSDCPYTIESEEVLGFTLALMSKVTQSQKKAF